MADRFQLEKALLPAVVTLALLFVAMQVPSLLVMFGVLIPVPLIFIYIQLGRRPGISLLALVFVVLFTLMGPKQAVIFFVEYAVLAGVMAETIRLRLSFDKCILLSTLVSAVLSIVLLLFVLMGRETTLIEFFQVQIEGYFKQSMEAFKAMGEPTDLKEMQEFADRASGTLAQSYPSLIIIGTFITTVISYYMTRFLWGRIYSLDLFHPARFSGWAVPDQTIWVFIGSGALIFLADHILGTIAMNLFFIALIVYFLQGLAILIYFLESRNVPVFFWVLIFFVIVFQPLLIGAGIGLGIFDTWMDLRKIRTNREQGLE